MKSLSELTFTLFFLLTLAFVYTSFTISVGSSDIIAAPALISSGALVAMQWRALSAKARTFCLTLGCALIPTFIAVAIGRPAERAFASFALLGASMIMGLAVFLTVRTQRVELLSGILLTVLVGLLVGATLERYTGFKAVSDAFGRLVYHGRLLYGDSARDQQYYGFFRPKVFASEPSFTAKAATFLAFGFMALSRSPRQLLIGFVLSVYMFFILRSPELLVCYIIYGGLLMVNAMTIGFKFSSRAINMVVISGLLAMLVLSANAAAIAPLIGGNRGAAIANGSDASAVERVILPPKVFFETLSDTWVGTGLGAKVENQHYAKVAATAFGSFRPQFLDDGEMVWGNGFYDLVIALGPIFICLFFVYLTRLFPVRLPGVTIFLFAIVFLLDVGAPNPRSWFYFGMLAAIFDLGLVAPQSEAAPAGRRGPPRREFGPLERAPKFKPRRQWS